MTNARINPIDSKLAKLESLKHAPTTPDTVAQLANALGGKSNIIAAKAAGIVAAARVPALEDALVSAFERFVDPAIDKGCLAKLAIVKALAELDSRAEDIYLRGSRLVQKEASWGGTTDVAIELRCECAMQLVRMNSRQMMVPLVHLLADENEQARATAARALAATGHDDAALLLRLKILTGDAELSVIGDSLTGFLQLTRSTELIEPFLDSEEEEIRATALMALGESRLPAAADLLIARLSRAFSPDQRRPMLLALAINRQRAAIDYLLNVIREGGGNAKQAMTAMEMFKSNSTLWAKIEAAASEGRV